MKRILAILLVFSCIGAAAEQSVHWQDLSPLITGKRVVLRLEHARPVKGNAVGVGADSISIETRTGRRSIPRASIREIRVPKRAGYKWRAIGTAAGAGVGAAVAVPVLAEAQNETGGLGRYGGAAIGLIAGLAALGFLAGWSVDHKADVIHILPD
ncbi:MAG: hypothetical protein ACRD45_09850 [Bryobacteraceae bacterium]